MYHCTVLEKKNIFLRILSEPPNSNLAKIEEAHYKNVDDASSLINRVIYLRSSEKVYFRHMYSISNEML